MNLRARGVLSCAAAVLVPTALAHADINLIAGAACVRADGDSAGIEYSSGRGRMTTSVDATLVCPVIRDAPTTDLVDARVYVTDASSDGVLVNCTLMCCTNAATSCASNTDQASDGGGDQSISFDAIDSENDGP